LDGFQQLLAESAAGDITLRAIVSIPAEPKALKKKVVEPSVEKSTPSAPRSAEPKSESDSQAKERDLEKVVSQVKGIYRDEDENLVASVKHTRSSFDSSRSVEEEVLSAFKTWNYTTAVNIPDEEEEPEVEEVGEDSMHIISMPVGALLCSKVLQCSLIVDLV
jgi:hypothetical protein